MTKPMNHQARMAKFAELRTRFEALGNRVTAHIIGISPEALTMWNEMRMNDRSNSETSREQLLRARHAVLFSKENTK